MFIIELIYIQPLKSIDEHMVEHIRFLDKHYASGNFIMSGRKVPRTGGIIIAKGATKKAVEKIMKRDPFYKHGLAEFTITEFNASQKADNIDELMNEK
ncbi:MAG: YciI family protein [Ferruginibacter sp.]